MNSILDFLNTDWTYAFLNYYFFLHVCNVHRNAAEIRTNSFKRISGSHMPTLLQTGKNLRANL